MTVLKRYSRYYKSGWCGISDMHKRCAGQYGMTVCTCKCHKEAA
jgi:hypothetical protein